MKILKNRLSRRNFIWGALATAGAGLLPESLLARPKLPGLPPPPPQRGRRGRPERPKPAVEPFPMKQVRLHAGPFQDALEINRQYLHSVPSDRLLHMFRLTAGLPSSAEPLGGWESPKCELRGHFSGGHYLSACALMYATTGDEALKQKADAMVAELAKCQQAHKNGYLSAFPVEEFDRLRDGQPVWAPFYTLHKIMAGHLDMYQHCGNQQALDTLEHMARWVGGWVGPLSDDHMARVLEVEQGGMFEVLSNLFGVTGKWQYLGIAHRFDQRQFFDPLAAYRDELKGLHANTNIPKVIGAARFYELTGWERYRDISNFFWEEVTARRAFLTGGTSDGEHWESDAGNLSHALSEWDEECCCGYNMLKLTRHVYTWGADPRMMDYYERTLFNSRLGTEDGEGMKSYFVPLAAGYFKYYNSRYNSFWCCTGTGAEEFSKFNDSIYFHDDNGIYVNLLIASEVSWPEKGVRIEQATKFPAEEMATFIVHAEKPLAMAVNLRIPYWATKGGTLKLNGETLPVFSNPSSYLTLQRTWKDGDRIELALPMSLHAEQLLGDPTTVAQMYGPMVLAGRLGSQGLTEALMHPGYDTAPRTTPVPAPMISVESAARQNWVEPVPGETLKFRTVGQSEQTELIPFFQLAGERYVVYWKTQVKRA